MALVLKGQMTKPNDTWTLPPSKNDGGDKFHFSVYQGATLLDYFAGQAIQGLLSNTNLWILTDPCRQQGSAVEFGIKESWETLSLLVPTAYDLAQAMVDERERRRV